MEDLPWREEVARQLEHCAQSLRARSDRQALIAFGTAVAYLSKAQANGKRLAGQLLSQVVEAVGDGPTQRFTFSPGELETIKGKTPQK